MLKGSATVIEADAPGDPPGCAPSHGEDQLRHTHVFLNGNLVHFAAFKKHIGFYPTSSAIAAFEQELSPYKWSKGAVQFPMDKPLPLDLVSRMVRLRVKEQRSKRVK